MTDATPGAGRTELQRRSDGQIDAVTDPRGNTTSYSYDTDGHLVETAPPSPRTATTIAYDSLSRVASVTDGNGHTTSYTYDALDRLVEVAFHGGGGVAYSYDAAGNLVEQTDATGTRSYSHDALGRRVAEQLPEADHTYTWDPAGNLVGFTDRTGTVAYAPRGSSPRPPRGRRARRPVWNRLEPGGIGAGQQCATAWTYEAVDSFGGY